MNKICLVSLIAFLLAGCATTNSPPGYAGGNSNNQPQVNTQVQEQLAQAASSVQASLQQLAAIEKLQAQNNITLPLTDIHDPALNLLIGVKWYGPIEPLLSKIAQATGYQFQIYGIPPSLPILVNIDTTAQPTPAINIIRNADLQAGLKVDIIIFTDQKVISLRYNQS